MFFIFVKFSIHTTSADGANLKTRLLLLALWVWRWWRAIELRGRTGSVLEEAEIGGFEAVRRFYRSAIIVWLEFVLSNPLPVTHVSSWGWTWLALTSIKHGFFWKEENGRYERPRPFSLKPIILSCRPVKYLSFPAVAYSVLRPLLQSFYRISIWL